MPDEDGSEDSPIIDLASLGFMPDMGEMARNRISSAQQRLGMTTEEFAAALDRMVDWEVTPEAVRSWMTVTTPPGDIIIAADLLVQHGSRSLEDESAGTVGADIVQELVAERFADLVGVYPSRAAFSSALPPHVLFDGAHDVSIAGLSLNIIGQQYHEPRLRQLIESGCTMRCLFLDPSGNSIKSREREEDFRPGQLSMFTEMNMDILNRVRAKLPDDAQRRLQLRTYDQTVRFNIVLIDRRIGVVQPYMPGVRGVDSPTFVLRRLPSGHGLMPAFESVFHWLWERGKPFD